MKDILFSLYLEYCRLQDKYQELMRDYNDMWDRKNRLQRRCEALEKSVEELEVMKKDYGRIREFFGVDKVDSLILEIKEKERLECEKEKERRKLMRRNQRDTR